MTHVDSDESPGAERNSVLERVRLRAASLSKSERRVAEVVLDSPSAAVHRTMANLAATAGVSEPTVMRFCTSVGCESYQDFRIQLAQAVALGVPLTHSAIALTDTSVTVAEKIFDHSISSLDRARRHLDAVAVEQAVIAILQCSNILFVGFGASGIIAQDAEQKWPLFGVPCQAPQDFHQQFIAATLATDKTVVVAISNTGSTRETVMIGREAKASGATVIAITGSEGPLADIATIALFARTFENTDVYTPSTSRLAGLVLVDVLATSVAMRRSETHQKQLRAMKASLAAMRREED